MILLLVQHFIAIVVQDVIISILLTMIYLVLILFKALIYRVLILLLAMIIVIGMRENLFMLHAFKRFHLLLVWGDLMPLGRPVWTYTAAGCRRLPMA